MPGAEDGGPVGPSPDGGTTTTPAAPTVSAPGPGPSGGPMPGNPGDTSMTNYAGGGGDALNNGSSQGTTFGSSIYLFGPIGGSVWAQPGAQPAPMPPTAPPAAPPIDQAIDQAIGQPISGVPPTANEVPLPHWQPSGVGTLISTTLSHIWSNPYASPDGPVWSAEQIQQAQQSLLEQFHASATTAYTVPTAYTASAFSVLSTASAASASSGSQVTVAQIQQILDEHTAQYPLIYGPLSVHDADVGQQAIPAQTAGHGAAAPVLVPQPSMPFTGPLATSQLNNLAPINQNLRRLLKDWSSASDALSLGAQPSSRAQHTPAPNEKDIREQLNKTIHSVCYKDLEGDHCDLQGVDWASMGITRHAARAHRQRKYTNYVSVLNSDTWPALAHQVMPHNAETYFRFRKMHIRKATHLAHFQLRNLLATASRSRAFYADRQGIVRHYNTLAGTGSVAMRFAQDSRAQISTIAAGQGVLVAGGFGGEYCVTNIDSEYVGENSNATQSEGIITTDQTSGISNHIQIHSLRNAGGPLAAFASNDYALRVLDLNTQVILSDVRFKFPVNCTAISPDKRLRVVVGDDKDAYIVAADPERSIVGPGGIRRPEILQKLHGHRDFGFACAWADDGYTIATGNQDRAIKIWDARKTCTASGRSAPIATLRTDMAGVRSLQFSPAGSGKRVLIAAEEADFISIIDAQTFQARQSFDIFGEIAGVSLTDNGQDMLALCADWDRGGLLQFERCGLEAAAANFDEAGYLRPCFPHRPGRSHFDWPDPPGRSYQQRHRTMRRRLRSAVVADLEPF